MRHIVWTICLQEKPVLRRYCKRCKSETDFICSDMFRVNAQRKTLDVWLIYKCDACDHTWNMPIYSRAKVSCVPETDLVGFEENDPDLVSTYAFDVQRLKQLSIKFKIPSYDIAGDVPSLLGEWSLTIENPALLPLRIESVLRRKLLISRRQLRQFVEIGTIASDSSADVLKDTVGRSTKLMFRNLG